MCLCVHAGMGVAKSNHARTKNVGVLASESNPATSEDEEDKDYEAKQGEGIYVYIYIQSTPLQGCITRL